MIVSILYTIFWPCSTPILANPVLFLFRFLFISTAPPQLRHRSWLSKSEASELDSLLMSWHMDHMAKPPGQHHTGHTLETNIGRRRHPIVAHEGPQIRVDGFPTSVWASLTMGAPTSGPHHKSISYTVPGGVARACSVAGSRCIRDMMT